MHDGQVRRIMVQADGKSRLNGNDIEDLHVRNGQGKLLPLSSFVRLGWTAGPPQLTRYNNYTSFTINGSSAPGKSSGDAMNALEQITASLPQGVGFEWTGQSYEEKLAGSQATLLFALSILIVFLVLAALYESWSIPLAVILVVPLGLLGALLAVFLRDMPNDIYFKVGLITTIGLSAKNTILIVEVAREFYREGMNAAEAAVAAAKLRLRPILMTSLAFGAGVVPLAFAHGAASRRGKLFVNAAGIGGRSTLVFPMAGAVKGSCRLVAVGVPACRARGLLTGVFRIRYLAGLPILMILFKRYETYSSIAVAPLPAGASSVFRNDGDCRFRRGICGGRRPGSQPGAACV